MKKTILTSAIIVISMAGLHAQQMRLFVNMKSGVQSTFVLCEKTKLSFESGSLKIGNETFELHKLRSLTFGQSIGLIAQSKVNNNLKTYPNPVSSMLTIEMADATIGAISIVSLDGRVMQSQNINGNNTITINIGNLPKGIYICRYNTLDTVEATKIVKQ